jgi:hypothetical protein
MTLDVPSNCALAGETAALLRAQRQHEAGRSEVEHHALGASCAPDAMSGPYTRGRRANCISGPSSASQCGPAMHTAPGEAAGPSENVRPAGRAHNGRRADRGSGRTNLSASTPVTSPASRIPRASACTSPKPFSQRAGSAGLRGGEAFGIHDRPRLVSGMTGHSELGGDWQRERQPRATARPRRGWLADPRQRAWWVREPGQHVRLPLGDQHERPVGRRRRRPLASTSTYSRRAAATSVPRTSRPGRLPCSLARSTTRLSARLTHQLVTGDCHRVVMCRRRLD